VLETLPGVTLAALLDDVRRVSAGDAMVLGAQLASALSYLHGRGWLHLDLTPTNVVVAGGVATLIDLSLARQPGRARAGAGTAGYRSPEQVAGGELSEATDVWGLALLLHEALSGQLPGTPDRPDGAIPLRRRQGMHRLPSELVELVNAGLSADPRDRPALSTVLRGLGGVPVPLAARAVETSARRTTS
jgi:serine/threonine protein kinase